MKKSYTAFKMWKIDYTTRGDEEHNIVRDAWHKFPGCTDAAVVREARAFEHSTVTHTGVRLQPEMLTGFLQGFTRHLKEK